MLQEALAGMELEHTGVMHNGKTIKYIWLVRLKE